MISISVQDLKPVLAGFSKIITGKHQLPCLRCVRVDATPEHVSISATDLDMYARFSVPEFQCDTPVRFLLPLDCLQSMVRRFPPRTVLNLEPGKISCDLGTGRVVEDVESPSVKEFPEEPVFEINTVPLPESFARRFIEAMGCSSTDASRYVLNGVQLDVSNPASNYLVGTDGRHLFSANSFALPLSESAIIPNHKLLLWRGLADLPWAIAGQRKKESSYVRIVAGDWTLTMKVIDGNYPNWRQVIPDAQQHRTTVRLPDEHQFSAIVNGLPGGEIKDKPVDLVIEGGAVAVKDVKGGSSIRLVGATASGPDVTARLNRDFLTKAFDYGLNNIGLIDAMSALHFTKEGRQMVVMPLRVTAAYPPSPEEQPSGSVPAEETNQPAPTEPAEETKAASQPQPESKSMTEATINRASTMPYINGASRSTTTPMPVHQATDKPAIEAAIDKIDGFKMSVRETLAGLTELTTLLRQAVRDQKTGEKEIHTVRQTLKSLQGLRF